MKNVFLLLLMGICFVTFSQTKSFYTDIDTPKKPWTTKPFENDPNQFQFAIVSDRTGGVRKGVFGQAVDRLNFLMPEFVMSVGDLIEGYTENRSTIQEQWVEFDSILNPLDMRFFALPGNHDISNDVMRKKWLDRYGRAYYYFIYKNVLFLAMDTNDADGDGKISDAQIQYFKKILKKHPNVRWTLVFMHHPVWLYPDFEGFKELEKELKQRPYSVFAGHTHHYTYEQRNQRNYYVLSTTGGGSKMRGVNFGEFDHVAWVTLTDKGPKMLNLQLKGMIHDDIMNKKAVSKKNSLVNAANFNSIITFDDSLKKGELFLNIINISTDSIFFDGKFYHNHHLDFYPSTFKQSIAPEQIKTIKADWKQLDKLDFNQIDPIEMDFTIGYKTSSIENPFELSGTYVFPTKNDKKSILFQEPNVFVGKETIALNTFTKGVEIKYTTDGTVPTANSKTYTQPIEIERTTTICVALFSENANYQSEPICKTYTQVRYQKPITNIPSKKGLKYQYFEGNFTDVPDFSKLKPSLSGTAQEFDVEKIAKQRNRIDHYAINYLGFVEVPEDGLYTFYTASDDGSQLFINEKLVVDNSGSHSMRTRKGYIALKKGKHPIKISYFEDYLGQKLQVFWKLPNRKEKEIIDFTHFSTAAK